MSLRDEAESVLRAWHAYEVARGSAQVIDFDCAPQEAPTPAASSRLAVYEQATRLLERARADGLDVLARRLTADTTYLEALLGHRHPLDDYIRATQGCSSTGWTDGYVAERGELARKALAEIGVAWGPDTSTDLTNTLGPVEIGDAPEIIRAAAEAYEPTVRECVGSTARFELTIETVEVDAYWGYWTDGAGHRVRLRLNLRNAKFTHVAARQFALHEILGHGLQGASWAQRCATHDVPWVRLMSVHANQQVLLEGLAQAMPLFIAPDDVPLIAKTRLDHYIQLVQAELHLGLEAGMSTEDLVRLARGRVPYWDDETIADILTDRGTNAQLRSYLWAYPAGIDWFVNLAERADPETVSTVLHAAYREPLNPTDLAELWASGEPAGGTRLI